MERQINIDDFVNYKNEYTARLQKAKITGDKLTSLCPFHGDSNPSFSVDLKKGMYKCFSCGAEGNYINFRAQLEGIDTKEAYKKILQECGVESQPAQNRAYSVEEYAFEKRLPVDWLKQYCQLSARKEKDGTGYVYVPYLNKEGKQQVFRKRYSKGSGLRFKWGYGASGKLLMYGEWLLPYFYEQGKAIMVEGESDSQTLWFMGFPALGVPGASTYRAEWTDRIGDLQSLYLHIEPDHGGQTFLKTMCQRLYQGHFPGKVYSFSCGQFGVKDPSELYLKYGKEKAAEMLKQAISEADSVNLEKMNMPVVIEDAPLQLRQPEGWEYDEGGITMIDPKTYTPRNVCRCPIIITQRLKAIDTQEEKVEVAFKRDGRWKSAVFLRSTVFQSRNIITLADLGCTITSENAKFVVGFLGALEAENFDLLEPVDSTSTFGWQPGRRFVPGKAEGIRLDIDPSMARWASGYGASGTLEDWIRQTEKARNDSYRFRFMLASAFAAPLLKLVRCRNFFVYNWAGSKGGKTASLKAALSVWGNPERLMASFNATQVALERMAGIFSDLPLGLDERQLAGSKQEFLEKLVYMLAEGRGRARGSKGGELQELKTWRSIIIATGEEPIIDTNSQTGVATRMVEIVGAPFANQADAAAMHRDSCINFGHAGPKFIDYVLKKSEESIAGQYTKMIEMVKFLAGDKLDGNVVNYIAVVALADVWVEKLFYNPEGSGPDCTIKTADMVDKIIKAASDNDIQDVEQSAADFIVDWLNQKKRYFDADSAQDFYGFFDENGMVYVIPSVLRDALQDGGFNYRKTIKSLSDKEVIQQDSSGKNSVLKWIGGKPMRLIAINYNLLVGNIGNTMSIFGQEIDNKENPFRQT